VSIPRIANEVDVSSRGLEALAGSVLPIGLTTIVLSGLVRDLRAKYGAYKTPSPELHACR
jgi:hypothetical protein